MNPLRIIDDWLNGITMYRLLLYGLGVVAAVSVCFGFSGQLSFGPWALLLSAGVLLAGSYLTNRLFAWGWGAAHNVESSLITALILFFLLPPASTAQRALYLALAGITASGSKYLLAVHRKHIFNPAAFAAVAMDWLGLLPAIWWIGSPVLLPLTVVLGLLVLRKLRRFEVFGVFAVVNLAVLAVIGARHGTAVATSLRLALTSWPLIFLGSIMLTEPSTMPPQKPFQLGYAALVGGLAGAQWHWGFVATTPQFALVAGNLFSYAVSPKFKMRLRLVARRQLSPRVYDLTFEPDRQPRFQPGQYMEWTLPHRRVDGRGNRRTFTIASSPTEPQLHLGFKTYQPSSSYKRALLELPIGGSLLAGQVAGEFTLPADPTQKLAFIAGGIGITPFRSMVRYLLDAKQHRDIVLFYSAADPAEFSYEELLAEAERLGVKLVKVLGAKEIPASWQGHAGLITPELIAKEAPDFTARRFYISGPQPMVRGYARQLRHAGVPRRQIVIDFFSGY